MAELKGWKEYAVFIVLGMVCLMYGPLALTPYLGGLLGTYTSYGVTAIILCFVYWLTKKAKGEKS